MQAIPFKETYYEALQASGHGWHEDEHDIKPWLNYFLGIMNGAYNDFAGRAGTISGRGSKQAAIRQHIRSSLSAEFTSAEIRRAVPNVSQSYLSKTLTQLRDAGHIEPLGLGRSARWRRLNTEL